MQEQLKKKQQDKIASSMLRDGLEQDDVSDDSPIVSETQGNHRSGRNNPRELDKNAGRLSSWIYLPILIVFVSLSLDYTFARCFSLASDATFISTFKEWIFCLFDCRWKQPRFVCEPACAYPVSKAWRRSQFMRQPSFFLWIVTFIWRWLYLVLYLSKSTVTELQSESLKQHVHHFQG